MPALLGDMVEQPRVAPARHYAKEEQQKRRCQLYSTLLLSSPLWFETRHVQAGGILEAKWKCWHACLHTNTPRMPLFFQLPQLCYDCTRAEF